MAASPLDQFNVVPLIPLEIGGYDLAFTNSSLFMVMGLVITLALMIVPMRRASEIPQGWQHVPEMLYGFVRSLVTDVTGSGGMAYVPFVFAVFMTVLMGNMLGMLPYSFTYTSHIIVTGALGMIVISAVTLMGFINHGWHFLSVFAPSGLPKFIYLILIPIEVISFLSRPITLAMRLCANMTAGHTVLKVFALFCVQLGFIFGMAPMLMNAIIVALELLLSGLQAYIFTILTCVYLKDAIELHH